MSKWVVIILSPFQAAPQSHGEIYAEVASVSTRRTPAVPKPQEPATEYDAVAFRPKVEDTDSD